RKIKSCGQTGISISAGVKNRARKQVEYSEQRPSAYARGTSLRVRLDQAILAVFALIDDTDAVVIGIAENIEVVAQQIHLQRSLFRRHRFERETLDAHDANFVAFVRCAVGLG